MAIERESLDFYASVGEAISNHLEEMVDPEFLSPHEAMQPLYRVFGMGLTRFDIGRLTPEQLSQLAIEYNEYFEVDAIAEELVAQFLGDALRQWDFEFQIVEART